MLDDNLLTAASSIRANQAGNLTETQRELLKNKIGSLPVLVFMGVVVGLFMLALAVGGNLLLDYPLLLLPLMAVIILAVFGLNRLYGDLMIRLRFSDLALEQIPGHITWKGDHYQAEANGRSL